MCECVCLTRRLLCVLVVKTTILQLFFETQTVDGGAEHVLPLRNSNGSFTVDESDPMIYSNSKTVSLTFLSLIRSEIDALVNYASGQRHRLLFWRSK